MADILPAIMPKNLADLEEKVSQVMGAVSAVQVDVMDGKFVPARTWPYIRHDDYFEQIVQQEKGLPYWDQIDYEIDLMVANPLAEAENWMQAGAARLIAHIEGLDDKGVGAFLALKSEFLEVGLALGLDTPVVTIEPFLKYISCVQCMGIKRIGYQGEVLDERVIDKIKQIRELDADIDISVDGGVTEANAGRLIDAGATRLVSGSSVFGSTNPFEAIYKLEQA